MHLYIPFPVSRLASMLYIYIYIYITTLRACSFLAFLFSLCINVELPSNLVN